MDELKVIYEDMVKELIYEIVKNTRDFSHGMN